MRLPRSRFEFVCRVGAFGLLGWLLGTSVFPSSSPRVERASATDVASQLVTWTRAEPAVLLHGDFNVTPERSTIDWLAALAHSRHVVSWSGTPPAVAMTVEALPDPNGGARIDVAAPDGARIVLRDDASVIDSVTVARFGASVVSP